MLCSPPIGGCFAAGTCASWSAISDIASIKKSLLRFLGGFFGDDAGMTRSGLSWEAVYGIDCEVARYFFSLREFVVTFSFGFGKVGITFLFIGYRPALHAILSLPAIQPYRYLPGKKRLRRLWTAAENLGKAVVFIC
jgi:hypothetical protein